MRGWEFVRIDMDPSMFGAGPEPAPAASAVDERTQRRIAKLQALADDLRAGDAEREAAREAIRRMAG